MTTTLRQNTWILTLSLAAVASAYLVLVWLPRHRAIKEMCQEVETKRAFVAQATGVSAALLSVQRELDKAQSAVTRWEKAAPGKRDISGLYGKINALAKDARLVIGRFDPQPFVVHEELHEIPITMGCSGRFAQIHEFLRAIERLPATIWVESMRLEKTSTTAKDVQCELNLVVFSNNPQSSDYAKHWDQPIYGGAGK
jgi:Tfp pilus assembly protein PilO